MKYCQECGTQLNDTAKFCMKCGTPCGAAESSHTTPAVSHTDFSKYYGISFKDIFGKIIELTPQGVNIYRHKGVFLKFDNTISYKHILHINIARPSLINWCGYLSIVTANGGLSADFASKEPLSTKTSKELSDNQNVVCFRKMKDIEAIYAALTAILNG